MERSIQRLLMYRPLPGVLGDVCLVVDEHKVIVLSLYQCLLPSEPSKRASQGQMKPENICNIQRQ